MRRFLLTLAILAGVAAAQTPAPTATPVALTPNSWTSLNATCDGNPTFYGSTGCPEGRSWHAEAVNPVTNERVLFGGSWSTYESDTWTYNPNDNVWHHRRPDPNTTLHDLYGPCRRDNNALLYRPVDGLFWLFYGSPYNDLQPGCSDGFPSALGRAGIWTYDPTISPPSNPWTKITTASGSLHNNLSPCLVYDDADDIAIEFGGMIVGAAQNSTYHFTFNNPTWTRISPTRGVKPPVRYNDIQGCAWDSQRHQMVIFGGTGSGGTSLADTWAYAPSTHTWTQLTPVCGGSCVVGNPPARQKHAMVFYPPTGEILMWAGCASQCSGANGTLLSDTWVLSRSPDTWTQLPATPPTQQYMIGTYDPVNNWIISALGQKAPNGGDTYALLYQPVFPTVTPAGTATVTPAPAETYTPTSIPTQTPTDTPTAAPTNTSNPLDTPAHTPTITSTATVTDTPTLAPTLTLTGTPAVTPTATATATSGQVCTSFATGVCCDSSDGTNCQAPAVACNSNSACAGLAPYTICAGAGSDNAQAASTTSATYANLAFNQCWVGTANVGVSRSFTGSTYGVNNGLLQWDTSALPDNAVVTSATLTVLVSAVDDADARSLQGEWFNWGASCDAADWTVSAAGTALSAPNSSIVANADNAFALTGLGGNINLSGRTYVRLHESGGQPTGNNRVVFAGYGNTSQPGPRLQVCYVLPAPTPTGTAAPTSSPTATPTMTGTATATDTPTSTPTQAATATNAATVTPAASPTPTLPATPTPTNLPTATATATPGQVCTTFAAGVCCDSADGTNCKVPAVACTSNSGCGGQAPYTICAGAGADNAQAASTTPTTYASLAFNQCWVGTANVGVSRSFTGSTYGVNNGLLQWDTSALPDNAVVTSATLTVRVSAVDDADARSLQGEWFNWGASCDAADWTVSAAGTALSAPNSSIVANADNAFALTGLGGNINLSGRTYVRLHESGGQPTGNNRVVFAGYGNTSQPGPRLQVCYVLPTPTPTLTPP